MDALRPGNGSAYAIMNEGKELPLHPENHSGRSHGALSLWARHAVMLCHLRTINSEKAGRKGWREALLCGQEKVCLPGPVP